MEPFLIDTREQYDLCKAHGIEPLIDRRFAMEIRLRVSIQRELFGTGHTPEENERFYRWCWEHYPHICAECMRPLRQYSATYVSHIDTWGTPGNGPRSAKRQHPFVRNAQPLGKWRPAQYEDIPGKPVDC